MTAAAAGRLAVLGLLLVCVAVVESVLVDRLAWPFGAPDLMLLVVLGIAVAAGPGAGAGAGFAGGLVADCLSDHPLGVLALLLTVTGYLCGRGAGRIRHPLRGLIVMIALASGGLVLADGLLLTALGSDRPEWTSVLLAIPAVIVFDLVLAPVVVPVALLAGRSVPAVPR